MITSIWLHTYDCLYMITYIWLVEYDNIHMITYIWLHAYDYIHMILIYDCTYMIAPTVICLQLTYDTHIWSLIYGDSYMTAHIWSRLQSYVCSWHMILIYGLSSKTICRPTYDHMCPYTICRHMMICSYMTPIYGYSDIWYPYMGTFPDEM